MTRILYVVSPTDPEGYEFVRRHFANEPEVEVVYDRRHWERRADHASLIPERRRGDRRRHDVGPDLRAVGWALVHGDAA